MFRFLITISRNILLRLSASIIVGLFAIMSGTVHAQQIVTHYSKGILPQIREIPAKPIQGWVDFCAREPAECAVDLSEPIRIKLTKDNKHLIYSINKKVNDTIVQKTDMEIYQINDLWTLPYNGEGDCEDFQLFKRHLLVKKGLPARAMRMTVVIDEKGEGHAVLTILTDQGDYILDNKTDRIVTVDQSSYRFVKRESQSRIGWISLRQTLSSPETTANRR